MKNKYLISAQFVNTNARFDEVAKTAIKEAVSNYNTKSLIAKNPKQIVDYRFSYDEMTLEIELESEADLPMPTKALRLFSSYLVEKTSLDKYLSGKQLFKMTTGTVSKEIYSKEAEKQSDKTDSKIMEITEFKSLGSEDKQVAIYELLCEIRRELCR